ncbi:MAG: SOS response-associated peptidase [Gemmatimonadaceae bacterium]
MCGRFGLSRPEKLDLERFGVTEVPELRPRFNIAPSEDILVVRVRGGNRVADLVKWGLVPHWARSATAVSVNARGDTAFEKATFRDAMRLRRCLIPADLFYEWQEVPGQRHKQPFVVRLQSHEPFALGGIWDYWRPDNDAPGLATCAILTTDPNTLMTPIHDRMPVIVPMDKYRMWLDPRTPAPAIIDAMQAYPSDEMEAWPISLRVNSPKEDDAQLLDPVEKQGLELFP